MKDKKKTGKQSANKPQSSGNGDSGYQPPPTITQDALYNSLREDIRDVKNDLKSDIKELKTFLMWGFGLVIVILLSAIGMYFNTK